MYTILTNNHSMRLKVRSIPLTFIRRTILSKDLVSYAYIEHTYELLPCINTVEVLTLELIIFYISITSDTSPRPIMLYYTETISVD